MKKLSSKYKVVVEVGGDKSDPSAYIVLCRHGHLYRHSNTMLGAATNSRGTIAKRLMALPGVTVWQDGQDGVNVIFPATMFAEVAAVMVPRTRRRVSEETKAHLRAIGYQKLHAGSDSGERQRAPTP